MPVTVKSLSGRVIENPGHVNPNNSVTILYTHFNGDPIIDLITYNLREIRFNPLIMTDISTNIKYYVKYNFGYKDFACFKGGEVDFTVPIPIGTEVKIEIEDDSDDSDDSSLILDRDRDRDSHDSDDSDSDDGDINLGHFAPLFKNVKKKIKK